MARCLQTTPPRGELMERMSEGTVRKPRAHAETFRTDRAGGERRRTTVGLTLTEVQREEVSVIPTK